MYKPPVEYWNHWCAFTKPFATASSSEGRSSVEDLEWEWRMRDTSSGEDEEELRRRLDRLGVLRGELGAEALSDDPHGDRSIDPGEATLAVSPCDLRWCA